MSAPVPPQPTPDPAPSSTPPSSPAGTEPAPPAAWRAPDSAPAWAKGKTPEEILGIAQTLYGVTERFNQQGVLQSPPAPAPAPSPYPSPPDDDFVTGGAVRGYVDQVAGQLAPQLLQSQQQQASMALHIVKQEYQKDFQRFGPEIEATLATVPVANRTLDNLRSVVDFVRGRHVDEIALEKAHELAATLAPTLRSNGAGPSPGAGSLSVGLQHSSVPESFRQKAAAVGLDDQGIADFCRANGMTPQQFYDQFGKGQITAAVAENTIDRRSHLNTLRG